MTSPPDQGCLFCDASHVWVVSLETVRDKNDQITDVVRHERGCLNQKGTT